MLQVVDFSEQLEKHIIELETKCEDICIGLQKRFGQDFEKLGVHFIIDFLRTKKGKPAKQSNLFEENYESFFDIGIEENEEYFPNAYIPIWKCKKEMFQLVGYLTKNQPEGIEKKLVKIIIEMFQEKMEEQDKSL